MENQTRVVVADDHPLVLSGIKTALARVEGLLIVAEASDGNGAIQAIVQHRPDLLILDVNMPGLASDQVVIEGQRIHPNLKTLILSAFDDEVYVRRFCRTPIHGYMLKDEAPESLSQAVRVIQQGSNWYSQSVASVFFSLSRQDLSPLFSEREENLLALLATGVNNREIARQLGLARQTVSNLFCAIYQKMGVNNRIQSLVWLQENSYSLSRAKDPT